MLVCMVLWFMVVMHDIGVSDANGVIVVVVMFDCVGLLL